LPASMAHIRPAAPPPRMTTSKRLATRDTEWYRE
jgi:hypothetical protein